jgi:hypothetical protein
MSKRRASRWLQAVTIVATLWCNAGRSEAAPSEHPSYVLTYAAPRGCPEEAWFIADVASHVHDMSRAGSVRVNATIEEREPGYMGTLVAIDPSGMTSSRQIDGKRCSEVAHALAFLTALALELGGHVEAQPPPLPIPAASPAPLPAHEPVIVPPPRTTQVSVVLLGGVRGGLGSAVQPSGEAGVEIGSNGRVLAPSLRLVTFVANGSLDGAGGSAVLWLVGGRLELCPLRFASWRFAVRPCLGTELGAVRAEGQTAFAPRTATTLWASAEATLSAQWFATNSWFVELEGGPVVPLDRTRYYFEPNRGVYVVPGLTARAAVGMGWLF